MNKPTKEQIEIIKLEKGIMNIDNQMERVINDFNNTLTQIGEEFDKVKGRLEIVENYCFVLTKYVESQGVSVKKLYEKFVEKEEVKFNE